MNENLTMLNALKGVSTGPKPVLITENEIKLMAMIMCPLADIAAFYGFSDRQLYRRFAQQPELKEAFKQGRAQGRRMIRQKQFTVAVTEGDSSMLKWLGMNILGQSNRHTMLAEDLNPVAMGEAIDTQFTEMFNEIDEELKADGILIEHQAGKVGANPPVEDQ